MSEFDRVRYCPKCLERTPMNHGGSGRRCTCQQCGTEWEVQYCIHAERAAYARAIDKREGRNF